MNDIKRVYENEIKDKTDKVLYWEDNTGKYKIGYSQELQKQELEVKKRIEKVLKWIKGIGLVGIIVLVTIAILLSIIVFTDVLQNLLRNMVGC